MNAVAKLVPMVLLLGIAPALADTPIQPQFRLDHFHTPLKIDNWLLPMQPGTRVVFYELEDGECKVNDVVVTKSAKRDFQGAYAGLTARAVTDRVWADDACDGTRGTLLENTVDWYGQDDSGNVWYFGEDTTEFLFDDNGNPIGRSKEGTWSAGHLDAKAGIVMYARPILGLYYRQEHLAGVAVDNARIDRVDIQVATRLGHFRGCLRTSETTPLSPGDVEYKYYCPNIGLVRVVAPTVHGGAEAVELGLH